MRHADAAAAGGQSAPARFPPARRSRADQPARLQQRGPRGRAGASHRAQKRRRPGRRQYRREQRLRRPRRRLCAGREDLRAGRGLSHRQHLLAQHAGPARSPARRGARRSARPRHFRARRGGCSAPLPRPCENRAGCVAERARRHHARRAGARHRRDDRVEHDAVAPGGIARGADREAAGRPLRRAALFAVDARAGADISAR